MFEFGALQGAILLAVDYLVDPVNFVSNPYVSDLTLRMMQRQSRQTSTGVAWQDTPNGVNFGVITNVTQGTNTITVDTHFDYHSGDIISAMVNGLDNIFTIQNVNGNTLTLDKVNGLAANQTVTFIPASLPEFGDVKNRTVKWGRNFLFQMITKMNEIAISHLRQNQLNQFITNPIVNGQLQLMSEIRSGIAQHIQNIDEDIWKVFLPSVFNKPEQGLPNTMASTMAGAQPTPQEILTLIRKMITRARNVGFNFNNTELYVPNSWDNIMQDNKMIVSFESQPIENGVIGGTVRRLITNNVSLRWIPSLRLDNSQQCYMMNTDSWYFVTTMDGMFRPSTLPSGGDYVRIGLASSYAPHCDGLGTSIRGMLTNDGNVPNFPEFQGYEVFRRQARDYADLYQAQELNAGIDGAVAEIDKLLKAKRAEVDAKKAKITGTAETDNKKREALEKEYTDYVAQQNKILEQLKKV